MWHKLQRDYITWKIQGLRKPRFPIDESSKDNQKMDQLHKLRKLYRLKNIERANSVLSRKESSAEHTWSCLLLADYFLSQVKNSQIKASKDKSNQDKDQTKDKKLDRLKIYELLLYHDLIEIEAGDIPIHHVEERKHKQEKEQKAFASMKKQFPEVLKEKFSHLFQEFEDQKTPEAKFARAVDRIDALIHELDYKKDWKGWNEAKVRQFYQEEIKDVPIIKAAFEQILSYAREQGYFNL